MPGEGNEYSVGRDMDKIINNLSTANGKLNNALEKAKVIEGQISSTEIWDGKSQNTALELIQLIEQFHQTLITIDESQIKALNNLYNEANDFMQNNSIVKVWKDME